MTTNTNSIKVAVFGPNLSMQAQDKGNVHVHAAGCADCNHYGRGKRFGGGRSIMLEVKSARQVVEFMYADHLEDDASYAACRAEVWFAPCVALAE